MKIIESNKKVVTLGEINPGEIFQIVGETEYCLMCADSAVLHLDSYFVDYDMYDKYCNDRTCEYSVNTECYIVNAELHINA